MGASGETGDAMNDRLSLTPRLLSHADAERLWEAMLVAFPVIAEGIERAPSGCAQLVSEHAQALLLEWKSLVK
jgi:hypothetical protein